MAFGVTISEKYCYNVERAHWTKFHIIITLYKTYFSILQPSYPMVKLTQAEIASMIHRKEERRRDMLAELERRMQANIDS